MDTIGHASYCLQIQIGDSFQGMSEPPVSHHLTPLRHGGIVKRRRQAKNNFYTLTDTGYRLSKLVKGEIG